MFEYFAVTIFLLWLKMSFQDFDIVGIFLMSTAIRFTLLRHNHTQQGHIIYCTVQEHKGVTQQQNKTAVPLTVVDLTDTVSQTV